MTRQGMFASYDCDKCTEAQADNETGLCEHHEILAVQLRIAEALEAIVERLK